uniref:ABC transporter domain-containing protein n=1 Tax=Timema cristinae TaxID=61476 RepID=A0A7R9H070_TIMCR|nr:unnamed protein product [Timema cristinae]
MVVSCTVDTPNLSGAVKPGNLVAMMGASGAGKSTLMAALAHRSGAFCCLAPVSLFLSSGFDCCVPPNVNEASPCMSCFDPSPMMVLSVNISNHIGLDVSGYDLHAVAGLSSSTDITQSSSSDTNG